MLTKTNSISRSELNNLFLTRKTNQYASTDVSNADFQYVFDTIRTGVYIDGDNTNHYKADISKLRKTTKPHTISKIKDSLPIFYFSGKFYPTTNTNNFSAPNHILQLDFDKIDNPTELKEQLKLENSIAFAFISPSGTGVKAGLYLEYNQLQPQFNDYYDQIATYFINKYELKNIQFDRSTKTCNQGCYASFDPDIWIRDNTFAFAFTDELEYTEQIDSNITSSIDLTDCALTAIGTDKLSNIIHSLNIHTKDGDRYNNRIKCGFMLGGLITGGHVDETKAIELCINTFLAHTTKSTASSNFITAVNEGKKAPYTIEKYNLEKNKFWFRDSKNRLIVSIPKWSAFLKKLKSCCYAFTDELKNESVFYKIQDNILLSCNKNEVRNIIIDELKELNVPNDVIEFLSNNYKHYFSAQVVGAGCLPSLNNYNSTIKLRKETNTFRFLNTAYTVTADSIKEDNSKLFRENDIISHTFHYTDEDCDYLSELLPALAQSYNKENNSFEFNQDRYDYNLHILGMYLDTNKNTHTSGFKPALVVVDEGLFSTSGGTGKSFLIANILTALTPNTPSQKCKGQSFLNTKFILSDSDELTKNYILDDMELDLNNKADLTALYTPITNDVSIEKKNCTPTIRKNADLPQFLISMNGIPSNALDKDSTKRRIVYFLINNYIKTNSKYFYNLYETRDLNKFYSHLLRIDQQYKQNRHKDLTSFNWRPEMQTEFLRKTINSSENIEVFFDDCIELLLSDGISKDAFLSSYLIATDTIITKKALTTKASTYYKSLGFCFKSTQIMSDNIREYYYKLEKL